jgi:tetratricopeptide (TPR) repeat protein
MDPGLAELCQTIDAAELGRRIRDARLAAGLTQAQLAGDEVSIAFISRIEDGQRRADPELLDRMAKRANITLEELVLGISADERSELRFLVDQAEIELSMGSADAALQLAEKALDKLADRSDLSVRRAAQRVQATALEGLGDLDGAITTLRELASDPAPDIAWLRSLIALSRCQRAHGDHDGAIAVGEEAYKTIESLGIAETTEAIQLRVTVAGAYFTRGDAAHAMRLLKRAISDAEKLDSPVARASAYWNASAIEAQRGSHRSALDLAKQAMDLFEQGGDARNLGRLRSFVADLQLGLDPPDIDGALATLEQADRELAWSPAGTIDLAGQYLSRSDAHILLGDLDAARAALARCAELDGGDTPAFSASMFMRKGQIAAAEGRPDEARLLYQSAAQILTSIGADRSAAQTWFELGALLEQLGDAEGAHDAFRSAAASSGLRG